MSNSVNLLNKVSNINKFDLKNKRCPQFLTLIFFVEMWERFSYYGMRALLVLFLTSHLGFTDTKAYAIYSLFAAIGYTGPVIGGFLADKLMGFRNMVLIGGIVMIMGHICMIFAGLDTFLVYLGLALIAVGTGLFKGNITNLLGSCYKDNDSDRERGFTLFYVGVNLGSFLASILCGFVASNYGWDYGFGLAGIGMFIGLVTFAKFQNILGSSGLSPMPELMSKKLFLGMNIFTITIVISLLLALLVSKMLVSAEFFANILSIVGLVVFGIFAYIVMKSPSIQRQNLIALSIMIFFLMCFFGLEMQLGSLINLFTARNVDNEIFGIMLPASVSQAINPISIVLLGSLIGTCIKFNRKYSTMMLGLGLVTLVLCFVVLYIGCVNADSNGKVGYLYLVAAVAFMSLGEICIAPLVQSQATLLSPKNLRGFIMGIVMLSLAFSNLAGIILARFMSVPSVKGKVDAMESLAIYKEGFLDITFFNAGIVLVFLVCSVFLHKVLSKQNT
jgi:POT family proton-dependent oligopeptide transporter